MLHIAYGLANAALTIVSWAAFLGLAALVSRWAIYSLGPDAYRTFQFSMSAAMLRLVILAFATAAWIGLRHLGAPFVAQGQANASVAALMGNLGSGITPGTFIAINLDSALWALYALAFIPLAVALFCVVFDYGRLRRAAPVVTVCPTCGRGPE